MPVYEYQCPRCGEVYEEEFRIGQAPSCIDCADEDCGGAARLVISSPTFILKGSCWANDGYGPTSRTRRKAGLE